MSSIQFSPAKDAELAWVDGQIHFAAPTARGLTQNEGVPCENVVGGEDSKEINIMEPILDVLTEVCSSILCMAFPTRKDGGEKEGRGWGGGREH